MGFVICDHTKVLPRIVSSPLIFVVRSEISQKTYDFEIYLISYEFYECILTCRHVDVLICEMKALAH